MSWVKVLLFAGVALWLGGICANEGVRGRGCAGWVVA